MAATPNTDTHSNVTDAERDDVSTPTRCPYCAGTVSRVQGQYWWIVCATAVTPVQESELTVDPGDAPAFNGGGRG